MHLAKHIAITLALLLICRLNAHAFLIEGSQCNVSRATGVTTGTTHAPTGAFNVGDVQVLVVVTATTGQPDITLTGASQTWTQVPITGACADGAGDCKWSTNGNSAVFWDVSANGETYPTINQGGVSGTISYTLCAIWGLDPNTPFDGIAGVVNGSSDQTITFPSLTPTTGSDELILDFAGNYGASPTITPATITTGPTAHRTTSDMVNTLGSGSTVGVVSGNPDNVWYWANQGIGSSGNATSTPTFTTTATAARNLGLAMLLKPAPFAQAVPQLTSLIARHAGVFDLDSFYQNRVSVSTIHTQPWLDGFTAYEDFASLEPNACNEFGWDYLDNQILQAKILGKKITLGVASGTISPCGGAGQPSCTGFTDFSNMPKAWALTSTTCDGNHAMVAGTDYINSFNHRAGSNQGFPTYMFDPNLTPYQTLFDSVITALGDRYGTTTNITGVYATGSNQGTIVEVWDHNNGKDGSTVACGGTSAQCTAICGSSSCSVTIEDGVSEWLTLTPAGGGSYANPQTVNTGTCSGSNQPFPLCDTVPAAKHFESSWATAFPHAAVMFAHQSGNGSTAGESCPGCYKWTTNPSVAQDPFIQDMFVYDEGENQRVSEMDASAGCNNVTASCPVNQLPTYLPYSAQPSVGISFQEVTATNSNTAFCDGSGGGTAGYNSISPHNCTIPEISQYGSNYGILQKTIYPYNEFYLATLQNTESWPWFQLFHQFAVGQ